VENQVKTNVFKLLSLASQPVKTSRQVSKRHDGCNGKKTRPSKSANTLAKQRGQLRLMWLCRCRCGKEIEVDNGNLKLKYKTKSCGGCGRSETKIVHGEGKRPFTKEYKIWLKIKQRCYDKNNNRYKYYGGRGINVCDRWLNDYRAFLTDMGRCSEGYSIERIDVNGNYEPKNCKWIPLENQAKNRRCCYKNRRKYGRKQRFS